jgi:hypothetical protein
VLTPPHDFAITSAPQAVELSFGQLGGIATARRRSPGGRSRTVGLQLEPPLNRLDAREPPRAHAERLELVAVDAFLDRSDQEAVMGRSTVATDPEVGRGLMSDVDDCFSGQVDRHIRRASLA